MICASNVTPREHVTPFIYWERPEPFPSPVGDHPGSVMDRFRRGRRPRARPAALRGARRRNLVPRLAVLPEAARTTSWSILSGPATRRISPPAALVGRHGRGSVS